MEVQSRTKSALEIIEQGQPFRVGNLLLSKSDSNCLAVTGWTQYMHLNSLSRSVALEELAAIKNEFESMTDASNDWKEYVKCKVIEYNLAFDDYGKAGISICREKSGEVTWLTDIKI